MVNTYLRISYSALKILISKIAHYMYVKTVLQTFITTSFKLKTPSFGIRSLVRLPVNLNTVLYCLCSYLYCSSFSFFFRLVLAHIISNKMRKSIFISATRYESIQYLKVNFGKLIRLTFDISKAPVLHNDSL